MRMIRGARFAGKQPRLAGFVRMQWAGSGNSACAARPLHSAPYRKISEAGYDRIA